jgi:hypothetical protein
MHHVVDLNRSCTATVVYEMRWMAGATIIVACADASDDEEES